MSPESFTTRKNQIVVLLLWWWVPIYLAMMMSGVYDVVKAVLLAIGILGALIFQHEWHKWIGASSSKEPGSLGAACGGLALAAGAGIALTFLSTPLIWLWALIGLACCALYSIIHHEIIGGLGWVAAFYGSYTVLTCRILPPLGDALAILGLGILQGLAIYMYRVMTGDYGQVPLPMKELLKLIVWLFIGTMVMGIGLSI